MSMLKRKKLTNNGSSVVVLLIVGVVVAVALSYLYLSRRSNQVTTNVSSTSKAVNTPEVANIVATDLSKLPLGDNKYSTSSASKGFIYSCLKVGGGGGAFKDGPWINTANGTWSKKDKNVTVDGSVSWSNASFSIKESGSKRELSGNGLPINNVTGVYPVSKSDDAYNYDRNPNSIQAQKVLKSIPLNPNYSEKPGCLNMGAVGYSLNGVAIFNALDGEGRDAAAHEILDVCGGHPERTGQYHYHDYSECMSEKSSEPKLIGYMLDGFGLYKYPINPTNNELDECHGKTSEVMWNGSKQSIYHYVITDAYPYTIGCYRGK